MKSICSLLLLKRLVLLLPVSALALWASGQVQMLRASPLFLEVSPGSGPPGAVVTLTMTGLDPTAPHTVSIAGTPGIISSVTSARLVFTVGAGSTSGDLVVGENGVNYTNPFPFQITRTVPGTLMTPPGISAQGYRVTALGASSGVDESGGFATALPLDRQAVVWAYRGEHDPVFLAVVPPATNQIAINARSTAAAWAFLSPLIGTPDETRGEAAMARVLSLAQTDTLANRITTLCIDGADYADDARFESALMALLDAYLSNPAQLGGIRAASFEPGTPQGTALRYLNPAPDEVIPPRRTKTQILPPGTGSPGYKLKFDSAPGGNRLDWFVEVYALDPDQFPNGFNSVDRLLPSDRPRKLSLEPIGSGVVKADLFSKKLDLIGLAADKMNDLLYTPLKEEFTFNQVALPSEGPGVYVSQAYSGNIWFGTTIFVLPPTSQSLLLDQLNADTQWSLAMAGNLFAAAMDGLSSAFPADSFVDKPDLKVKIIHAIAVDLSKALSRRNKQFFTADTLLEMLKTTTTSVIKSVIKEGLTKPETFVDKKFASASLKVIGKSFDFLGKYSKISQSFERFGGIAEAYSLALERSVAVIGKPWVPQMTSFFPQAGRGGEVLTIQGTHFDADTNTLRAGFCQFSGTDDPTNVTARLDLEILSVSAKSIAVRVPTNAYDTFPNHRAYVFIESGSNRLFGVSANLSPPFREFFIRPFPTVTSVSPNPVQGGGSLELRGFGFDALAAGDHKILIDGLALGVGYAVTETSLVLQLPVILPPGSHTVSVTLRNFATPPIAFQVAPPVYDPDSGQGFNISITRNDFSNNPDDPQITILEAIMIARGDRRPRQHELCEFLPPEVPNACPFVERETDHVGGDDFGGLGGSNITDTIQFPPDMVIAGPLPALSEGDRYVFGTVANRPIILEGAGTGAGADGLLLDGLSDIFVSGYLVIRNFSGNGVHLRNGANHNFFGNLQIRNCGGNGVFLDGDASFNEFRDTSISNVTQNGFYLSGTNVLLNNLSSSKGNIVFGTPLRYDIIAACGGNGIRLDSGAQFNAIIPGTIRNCGGAAISVSGSGTRANRFGRDGNESVLSYDLVNNGGPGAYLGPGAVGNVLRYLNPIGSRGDGVLLEGPGCSNNVVDRAMVGLNRYEPGGALTISNQGSGIRLRHGAQFNLIGAMTVNLGERGTIVGNRDGGVLLEGTNTAFNIVNEQNIGVVNPLTLPYQFAANGGAAIALRDGAHDNVIGNPNLGLANTIFASPVAIEIAGNRTDNNQVLGNTIGAFFRRPNWVVATGQGQNGTGIWIHDGPRGNIIGFPGTATLAPKFPDDPEPERYRTVNSIESCTNAGVLIENASGQVGTDGTLSGANVVQANLIGELENGNAAPPGDTGIKLGPGAQANIIGGPSPEAGNRIRGWSRAGIWIHQNLLANPQMRNRLQNNHVELGFVGHQSAYLTQTPAGGVGVLVTDSTGHTIGETLQTANKLQLNQIGVYLGDSANNTIRGFYITNNFNSGIAVRGGADNTIEGNLVHAIGINGATPWAGIALSGTSGNLLRANEIGFLAPGRGSVALLVTNANGNTIGGAAAADGNQILDGVTSAIVLTGPNTFDNRFFNNLIGEDRTGNARPNQGDGVRIENNAHDNFIGGVAPFQVGAGLLNVPAGNIIANNVGVGVRVTGAFTIDNRILFNSITGNGGKGISLEAGGNENVPPPLMTKVDGFQAMGVVPDLAKVPPGSIVQVFSNPRLGRIDEGERFLGEGIVASNGTWSAFLAGPAIPPLTMTATDTNGSTSEFGAGIIRTNFQAFQLVRTDNRPTGTAPDGAVRFPVLRLTALASNVDVVVERLTLDASGSLSEPSGVAAVELFRDVNGDGVVSASDPLLAGPVSFAIDNGQITFTNLNISIPANASQRWLVTYSLHAGASPGTTFQLRVTNAMSVPSRLAAQFGVPVYPTGPFPLTSAQFTINTQAQRTFALWKQSKFTPAQQADPNISGPNADPDGDGIMNLLEDAFRLEPLVADADSDAALGAGLPVAGRVTLFVPELGENRDFFTVTYVRLKPPADLAYALQETADFVAWVSEGQAPEDFALVSQTDVTADLAYEIVVVRSATPLDEPAAEPNWFYRVRVTWFP